MLRCMADENPESWPHRLPTVMAAYRMTVHRVTGVTPNMAMLGREVLPASLIAWPPLEPVNTTVPFVNDLRDVMRNAHERISQATKKEARMQRKYYDDRSRMTRFYEGQRVWLYWPRPPVQQFKKLTRLWIGPWKIVLFKSPVVVELHHVSNRRYKLSMSTAYYLAFHFPPSAMKQMTSLTRTTNQTLLTRPRYQMRWYKTSLVCSRRALCLSRRILRPWIHRNPILSFWTRRIKVLRPPGSPLGFASYQRLWNHISLAETLQPKNIKTVMSTSKFWHRNSIIITSKFLILKFCHNYLEILLRLP